MAEYLNRIREEMIEELQRAQDHNMENARSIRLDSMDHENEHEREELLKSQLFVDKFCFILHIDEVILPTKNFPKTIQNKSVFKLYLFIVDFYLNRDDFQYLK